MTHPPDKRILLSVADGPEGIELYLSEHEAVSDWAPHTPALYLVASTHDTHIKMGPFTLRSIQEQLARYGLTGDPTPENSSPTKSDAWLAALGAEDALVESAIREVDGPTPMRSQDPSIPD